MSRPWMPLYCETYIGHTTHLSAAESGAYLHLIMHYWVHEGLPTDEDSLARIAKMTSREWTKARPKIAVFFQEGWKHDRIEREMREATEAYERRAKAGREGGNAKARKPGNASALLKQLPLQIPSSLRSEVLDGFGRWFSIYLRPVDHDLALQRFDQIVSSGSATIEELIAGAERHRRENVGTELKWVKTAVKWLEGGCWKDGKKPTTSDQQALDTSFVRLTDPRWELLAERYRREKRTSAPNVNGGWYFANAWISDLQVDNRVSA